MKRETRHGELRFNMHRKTTILNHNKFMLKFIGDVNGEDVDIFYGISTPTKESPMYNTVVSVIDGLTSLHMY